MGMIIVDARFDRLGNLLVAPRNRRIRRKYEKHMEEMTGHADATVFFQEGFGAEDKIPARYHAHLQKGHTVAFKIDPWVFGHWLGWDAHEISV